MSEPSHLCRICEKWKDANDINFSKRELSEYEMKREYGHSTTGLQANMRCRLCAADGPREIECVTCLKNRPIAEFSKSQRIALATARCKKCINWYELNEPSTEVLPEINMGLHPDAGAQDIGHFGRPLNLGSDVSDEEKSAWKIAHTDNNTMSVPTDTSALATTAEVSPFKAATIEAVTSVVSTTAPASTSEPTPTEVVAREPHILGPSTIAATKPVSLILPSRDIYRGPVATASVGSSVQIPSIPVPSRPEAGVPRNSNTDPFGNLNEIATKVNIQKKDSPTTYHSSDMTVVKNSKSKGKISQSNETTFNSRKNDWAKPPKASKSQMSRQFENYVPTDPDFYAPPKNYNYGGYDSPDEA